jgi:16S rRNA (uracil1498-N3)-methyltransferase
MVSSIRLFVREGLAAGVDVALTLGQAHYLHSVMRRDIGTCVTLFNGLDGEWSARITTLRKDRGTLLVETQLRAQAPEADLWLVFAPLKHGPTDLVVQKATELGVSRLVPVLTERTNQPRINIARLASIATEAAEQCERLSVPEIEAPVRLPVLLESWPVERSLFAAVERLTGAQALRFATPAALLVGPEGGFTVSELDALASRAFVQPFSLGPRILRAETASIAGLALLQAQTCA